MSEFAYPVELPIEPLTKPPLATVSVPGSKSITNRALVLAALGSRTAATVLTGALQSEDTEVMVECLRRLGFRVTTDWPRARIVVGRSGSDRMIPATEADLFVGNSGTSVRFLAAMLGLGQGRYRLDGIPRMRERPIQDLLDALAQLGVKSTCERGTGCPPVLIETEGWHGNHVVVRGDVSSQFLSALLLAAPFAGKPIEIETTGPLVSEPYIAMSVRMVEQWGGVVRRTTARHGYLVEGFVSAPPAEYAIEPDASSASYFAALPAIAGGTITLNDMPQPGTALQGDVEFLSVLERMGCDVVWSGRAVTIRGGPLRGVDVDMNAISDTVMTLAVVALFAEGPTTIRNVAHIRHKETDRIAAVATELRKLGAVVEERDDGLTIRPRPLTGCAVDTYNDHRMAMSLSLVGLKIPGVVIRNPGCVAKTYPGFWRDLEKLRGEP
ncbi:MAG: 3-phosphoshikimate 1-carboxyvinyltransferase [Planctomycetia bacterium]|nr:3-phosphoshikimate 1-carboxyvinyltransferase [Planctomycetia bacterium]